MSKYAILVNEQTLDLIEFLNDGIRPQLEERPQVLVCEPKPREITTKIEFEDDLYENGHTKDPSITWVIV